MMGKWLLGQFYLFLIFLVYVYVCDSQEQPLNTYTISSFSYAETVIRPYEWRYIRVELPPWFSSMSLALESNADTDLREVNNGSSLPMICFREGSPPLPDVYNTSVTGLVMEYISNYSFVVSQSLQNFEKCHPMQKNIWLRVTNEQISPGTWFFGLFNGIGPVRTQSKMINRGSEYSFSGNISVEGCMTSTMLGQFCNQTVNVLSCSESYNLTGTGLENGFYKGMKNNAIACRNANGIVCHEGGPNIYSLDVMGIVDEIFVAVTNLTFNETKPSNATGSLSLMCYARHGSMPLKTVYDFSVDISKAPLVINFPKAGRWYITVQPIDNSNKSETVQSSSFKACYLLVWQVNQCPLDKAGLNCTFERHILQTVLRKNPSVPFESNYMPITQEVLSNSKEFPLEPFLSNFSTGGSGEGAWTFFLLDIPYGATGGNIHIHLSAKSKINYELYARYGGLPSLHSWDYFYANNTSSSNGSMFFKLYDSNEDIVSFYMLYVRGGTWSFGLRQINPADSTGKTDISLSLERCPQKCSSHGTCKSVLDTSGLMLYSYCDCDRDHGGFDCSVELVSHQGHIKQSIFLIASNAAAVLPAYWALHNKAFAEWVLYMSSGMASALYHSCDVGTWCILTFHVLQFLDFWLSFMAVVSTFVYLSTISEVSKRTIHTVLAIVTALLAETGPTRPKNIGYVIGLGTLGLLVGWGLEFCARNRTFSFPREFHLNLLIRWEIIKEWFHNIIKTIIKRFRWGFIIAGFATLAMAAISWKMESTESYWIWHSLWHISIYTSSFLFLCSKANVTTCENERLSDGSYELTRQNSYNGGEQRLER
ncbi:transmembrane protein-like protein [Perilla frutescens var. hirtella]|nr:transmembrane protein-like protein [Perilla frutescens var. hirtella]